MLKAGIETIWEWKSKCGFIDISNRYNPREKEEKEKKMDDKWNTLHDEKETKQWPVTAQKIERCKKIIWNKFMRATEEWLNETFAEIERIYITDKADVHKK